MVEPDQNLWFVVRSMGEGTAEVKVDTNGNVIGGGLPDKGKRSPSRMTSDTTLQTLFRERPADAALFTLGPLVIGSALLLNAVAHDLSLAVPAVFAALLAVYSVMITRQQLASVQLARLQPTWSRADSSLD